jgi:8-oxo-dGTP pyrophosphatase MutT (NUDIX family)
MTTRLFTMELIRERIRGQAHAAATPAAVFHMPESVEAKVQEEKRAAVATVLREGPAGPEVLLIRRAEHPNDPWSGHMAFPGGREDPGDPSLLATAVRETLEEVALDLNSAAELIGSLPALPAIARGKRTGLTIAPFVFELRTPVTLVPNYEVAETVWAPLTALAHGHHSTTVPYVLGGQEIRLPAHDVNGRIVWGLTYRMLDNLFMLLK